MAVFAGGQQLWRASLDSATSVRAEVTARGEHCHACRRPLFPTCQSTCLRTAADAREGEWPSGPQG